MTAVAGSGIRIMSDSLIPFQPAIDEPSNILPSVKNPASTRRVGIVTCCSLPSVSVKRRSANLASFSLINLRTSAGVIGILAKVFDQDPGPAPDSPGTAVCVPSVSIYGSRTCVGAPRSVHPIKARRRAVCTVLVHQGHPTGLCRAIRGPLGCLAIEIGAPYWPRTLASQDTARGASLYSRGCQNPVSGLRPGRCQAPSRV